MAHTLSRRQDSLCPRGGKIVDALRRLLHPRLPPPPFAEKGEEGPGEAEA